MRVVLAGALLAVLLGSFIPGLRHSERARSAALVTIGVAIVFEGLAGLGGTWSWLDAAVVAVGVCVTTVSVRRYRLASARRWRR